MLTKYISQQGQDWHLYLNACCYAHNRFVKVQVGGDAGFSLCGG